MPEGERIADLLPRLRRYARALTTSSVDADYLVRATLERAGAALQVTQATADVRAWLFSVMHETYVDWTAGRPPPPPGSDPDLREFERALAGLTATQREVFLLVTLEDMSYDDVARTLNIPLGTVMSRLSRAREKLRLSLMGEARLRSLNRS